MEPCKCGADDCPKCHPGCNDPVAVWCSCGREIAKASTVRECERCHDFYVCENCGICASCEDEEGESE